MNKEPIKNISASIRQRLLNLARNTKRPFSEVLDYYMIERFIYRLSQSIHQKKFVLKGALMFAVWNLTDSRATRDIDLLGYTQNTIDNVSHIIKDICQIEHPDDGVIFSQTSVQCGVIQQQNKYSGIRARFTGELAKARSRMQIDVGFGDIVYPKPVSLNYPTLLGMPTAQIYGYTPETLIAEKTHALIRHGMQNTRIKDYFDIWFLSRQFPFNGSLLTKAINRTFAQRKLSFSELEYTIFYPDNKSNHSRHNQWQAFCEKIGFPFYPIHLNWPLNKLLSLSSPY